MEKRPNEQRKTGASEPKKHPGTSGKYFTTVTLAELRNDPLWLNNLHQIGLALHMYADDNNDNLPPRDNQQFSPAVMPQVAYAPALGGKDPVLAFAFPNPWSVPNATNRLLYHYVSSFESFHCPADKGQNFPTGSGYGGSGPFKPSNYESIGCSYRFNGNLWDNATRQATADPNYNLTSKKVSWAPTPSLFIMVHEPPAFVYGDSGVEYLFHWHYRLAPAG